MNENTFEPEVVKIGFYADECKRKRNIITGKGSVYYYATESDYDANEIYEIIDFKFKYDIPIKEIFDVVCDNEDAKALVEADEDQFRLNLEYNLIPYLNQNKEKKEKNRQLDNGMYVMDIILIQLH